MALLVHGFPSPPLCYSLKITNYRMRKKKIFCIYGCFSVSRYIKEGRKRIFRHNRIFRHICMYKQLILTKSWNYNIFMQILYSYLIYTDRLFDVFFLLLAVLRAPRETKKERLSYRICVTDITLLAPRPPS